MFVTKIFDQQQASGAPTVRDCPQKDKLLHVRYVDWEIAVTGAKAAAGAATIDVDSWLKNSRLDTWYRYGDQRSAEKCIDNISLMGLSAISCLERDGTLTENDADCPRTIAVTGGATVDVLRFHLRQYFALPTAKRPDDAMVSLADLGDQQFTFANFDPTLVFVATNVQVTGYAVGSYKRQYTCVPRLRFREQGSRTPQLTDEYSLGGNKLRACTFFSQAVNTSPVTSNTFPKVKVDNVYLVEGDRMADLSGIARATGEIAYPQAAGPSQRAYAPAAFCPVSQADPDAQQSEWPAGDQLQLSYSASTATAGEQFLAVVQLEPLSDLEFARRSGAPVTGTAQAANGASDVASGIEKWLPRRA